MTYIYIAEKRISQTIRRAKKIQKDPHHLKNI